MFIETVLTMGGFYLILSASGAVVGMGVLVGALGLYLLPFFAGLVFIGLVDPEGEIYYVGGDYYYKVR